MRKAQVSSRRPAGLPTWIRYLCIPYICIETIHVSTEPIPFSYLKSTINLCVMLHSEIIRGHRIHGFFLLPRVWASRPYLVVVLSAALFPRNLDLTQAAAALASLLGAGNRQLKLFVSLPRWSTSRPTAAQCSGLLARPPHSHHSFPSRLNHQHSILELACH